jgi:hypothetical protein
MESSGNRVYSVEEVVQLLELFFKLGAASSVASRGNGLNHWDQADYLKSVSKMYINTFKSEHSKNENNQGRIILGSSNPQVLSDGGPRNSVGLAASLEAMASEQDKQKAVHEGAGFIGSKVVDGSGREVKKAGQGPKKSCAAPGEKQSMPVRIGKKV